MQTTLPLGSFFFVFTSHSFCVFELPLVLVHYYGGLSRSFDTLPVMSNSTFTSVMSGSISFRLLLLHFHYNVCPVRHPFDYHYFTITKVLCPVRHPFNCHYFIFTRVFVGFDMLSIIIISLFTMVSVRFCLLTPFNCHYFLFFLRVSGFATLLIIIIIITKGMSSNQTLLTRMGKKQTLLPGLLLTIVSACMRRLWLILLLLSILEMFVVFILIFTNYLILDLVCLCAIHVHKPSSKVFFFFFFFLF